MAKLKILKDGDTALRLKCRPVTDINNRILTLLDDMTDTMRHADGVGLAAPQIGVLRRVVVIECEPGNVLELINPVIVEKRGEQHELEGCLSVPGKKAEVVRPMTVTVEATDRNGNRFTYTGTELMGRCLCHEYDHLDGILYIDKADEVLDDED